MRFPRASGILLHPTSLPGPFGIGDLGPRAYEFVDFLANARQTYWQILPLGPTGYGDSPYQSFSAFAGSTLLISPESVREDGLLTAEQINAGPQFPEDRVDYGAVHEWKSDLLRLAVERFTAGEYPDLRDEFQAFAADNHAWLDDYALYRALKASNNHKPWYEWDTPLKFRDSTALESARAELRERIAAERFRQFLFFKQWSALKRYAAGKGLSIAGDLPIFVALDSADVWCSPEQFKLNEDGSPRVVAGVPPDFFSKTGQLWGNPIYDWDAMRRDGFRWWIERLRHTLKMVDIVRVDHFLGFSSAWEVPGGDPTAEHGEWVEVPGQELFWMLNHEFGALPLWAEDLGVMTREVEHLRDSSDIPGMRILQFAFAGDARNRDLPHNYINNCVAYTGTHDNDTAVGWFEARKTKRGSHERQACLEYLNTRGREIHWDFIRAVWGSVADTAVASLQDVLGLGNDARMNLPATTGGNWAWRFRDGDLTPEHAERLRKLTELYGREASPVTPAG